jgi:hypothetical protein
MDLTRDVKLQAQIAITNALSSVGEGSEKGREKSSPGEASLGL